MVVRTPEGSLYGGAKRGWEGSVPGPGPGSDSRGWRWPGSGHRGTSNPVNPAGPGPGSGHRALAYAAAGSAPRSLDAPSASLVVAPGERPQLSPSWCEAETCGWPLKAADMLGALQGESAHTREVGRHSQGELGDTADVLGPRLPSEVADVLGAPLPARDTGLI